MKLLLSIHQLKNLVSGEPYWIRTNDPFIKKDLDVLVI